MADTESQIVTALARAAAYRAFSLAFQAPTDAVLRASGAGDGFATLAGALGALGSASSGDAAACIERLRSAGPTAGALAAQYWRVFGHTTRGLVCPCETEYGDDNKFQQPQQLADISGYYLAFGLRPPSASEVRQDHVACECEFMAFLHLKQAWWLECGDGTAEGRETLEATRQAERSFLRDHLGHFGRAFASRLSLDDCRSYYGAWGALFLQFLDGECARAGVEGGPSELPVRAELTDDAPMACGSACGAPDELIQIRRHP
jgi:TorA maturation chaperone TorD